jgi:outer membrane protein OmpA-like peptidoglycan-associated protein
MNTLYKHISAILKQVNCKKMMVVLLLLVTFTQANSQTRERKWNAGVMGGFSVYAGDLGNSMTDFTSDVFRQNLIVGINLSRYINRSLDVTLTSTVGSFGYYKDNNTVFKGDMLHGNITLKYKFYNGYMISEDSKLAPYVFAGIGASNFSGAAITNNIDYPIIGGAGVRYRLNEVINITYQATFGYMGNAHNNPATGVTPTGNDMFMMHTLGLGFNLGKAKDEDKDGISDKKDKCLGTPAGTKVDVNGCSLDTDGDGIADYLDKCPTLAGLAATNGCPDTDKDGIADNEDQCPTEPGTAAMKGCPDTDGDGIIDSKDKCPNIKGSITLDGCPDRDGDGIRDEEDMCPDVKGVALFKGCPDTDGDGIEDSKDMCPLIKGTIATNGCPDTDNDGVHDGIDKCPKVAGSATHSGCPDTDNDGVYDDIDKCITIPGTASNVGCPELKKETKQLFEKALQGIQFETGKAVIKPVSFPILNAIVNVMKENSSYKLIIGGHTDNVGDDAMNMTLSQNRVDAVAEYLIGHGVDPMKVSATGYGESAPVDTNASVKGRTRNRRVEFKVEFLKVVE